MRAGLPRPRERFAFEHHFLAGYRDFLLAEAQHPGSALQAAARRGQIFLTTAPLYLSKAHRAYRIVCCTRKLSGKLLAAALVALGLVLAHAGNIAARVARVVGTTYVVATA